MTLAGIISIQNYVKEVVEDTKVLFGLRKHLRVDCRRDGRGYHYTPMELIAMDRSPTLYKQICEGL